MGFFYFFSLLPIPYFCSFAFYPLFPRQLEDMELGGKPQVEQEQ